ncbi:MAG TPA: protease pro-enzyme activation domain-containing protein, partial [Candidatus Acidoferrales bacterium]|nr:protease pro-enzyme activation domain-containing protein [Candidatus Acidoferrales bacterium]
MSRSLGFAPVTVAVIAFVFALDTSSAPQKSHSDQHLRNPRISARIDPADLVTLRGNTRPEANSKNDRGPISGSTYIEHILLLLRRSPEQEQALQEFTSALTDHASPNFHQWLNPAEFGDQYGVAQQDLDEITGWLESNGFTVNVVYGSGMMIDFSGYASSVRDVFHAELHRLDVHGQAHIANIRDPKIPAALAPVIQGIVSLNDFMPRAMYLPRAEFTFTNTQGTWHAIVPADLATIYSLNPLFAQGLSGQGQTIVVIEDTNISNSGADWTTFRSQFDLNAFGSGSFSQVHPAPPTGHSNCNSPGVNSDEGEASLDAEYASAAAPSAAIELASCKNTVFTFGGLIALQNIVNSSTTPPAIISISYGECEAINGATNNAAYNAAYQQAAAEGVSVFVSSGDEGAASCDAGATAATHGIGVSAFASTPNNVAVGGTDFSDLYSGTISAYWKTSNSSNFGSAKSYIPEIPWNDSCAGVLLATLATGSGIPYGSPTLCNPSSGSGQDLTVVSGSGGPSGCASGLALTPGVVSGTCAGYAKPSWQSGLFGNPSDGVRDIPDVSLFAANGIWSHYYVFCWSNPEFT